MKLYVCWGTMRTPRPGGHPCKNAYDALVDVGHDPQVVKTRGFGAFPSALNPGLKPVRELTGQEWVPVLETDDGQVIQDSKRIIAWAKANPAGAPGVAGD